MYMKKIGIIGAMTLEVTTLQEHLKDKAERRFAGMSFWEGSFGNLSVVVAECGIGKVNAAVCAQLMIDQFAVEAVVNTGIAGNMNPALSICDMVLSETVVYHDKDLDMMKRYFPFCDRFSGDKALLSLAERAYEALAPDFRCIRGTVATGEQFIAGKAVKEDIASRLHPDCVEMEGGAIGHTAHINGVPFVVIRSISDNADDGAGMSFENFMHKAAGNSAALVLKMLELLD